MKKPLSDQFNAFGARIERELTDHNLNFPTAFNVTLRIQRMANNPEIALKDIAEVIQSEPVLSARIVNLANSVLMNPRGNVIDNVTQAVQRIGLSAVRGLSFAVAAEQMSNDRRSAVMRELAQQLWLHSIDIGCWSYALAAGVKKVSPDTALFAGLLIDIGTFFLISRIAEFPALEEDMAQLHAFIAIWSPRIGQQIVEEFGLPDTVISALQYESWQCQSWSLESLADVLQGAALISDSQHPFDTVLGGCRQRWELQLSDDAPRIALEASKTAGELQYWQMRSTLVPQ